MGWLHFFDDGLEQWVEIPRAGKLIIGRSKHCDVVLTSPEVSRKHIIVQHHKGGDWVADPGTRNGTILNGDKIAEPRPLKDRDVVKVSDYLITYHAKRPAPAHAEASDNPFRTGDTDIVPVPIESPAAAPQAETIATPVVDGGSAEFTDTTRWKSVELIGRGGMGEVYRARDRDLGIDVAIKRLRRRNDGTESLLERLHAREAAIGRTIRHANVVQTLEDGVHAGDPYILLEWVEGTTLEDYVEATHATLFDRVEMLRQVALGLGAAHAAGVVHADLKPANLLVTEEVARRRDRNLGILDSPDDEIEESEIEEDVLEEITRRANLASPDFENPPFVGREGEMQLLEEIASQLRPGALRWVLIFGERGAGKARLAAEFQASCRERGVTIHETDGWKAPPAGSDGIWLTLLPPLLPDDEELHRDYEAHKIEGEVVELYLKPFLHGQSVRFVERMVHDADSARQFVQFVEEETLGSPARLLTALERSFGAEAWKPSGSGYRLQLDVLKPQEQEVARQMLQAFDADAKGVRDALTTVSALGSCLDFQTLIEATGVDRSSLYYILEHACKTEYLRRDSRGRYWFTSELLRTALCHRLDAKVRLKTVRKVLPRLAEILNGDAPPLPLFEQVASLESELGYPDRAFVCLVRGALRARLVYDRTRFLDLVDAARECYRACNKSGKRQRELLERAGEILGEGGRGLSGLERLRELPTAVRLKITDFGIARRTGVQKASDDAPWGTPRYMSPEQANHQSMATSSDVYSLGLVARELLERQHPLGGRKGRAAIEAIRAGGPGGPGAAVDLPDELKSLLGRMLSKEPKRRPQVDEVASVLQEVQLRLAIQALR